MDKKGQQNNMKQVLLPALAMLTSGGCASRASVRHVVCWHSTACSYELGLVTNGFRFHVLDKSVFPFYSEAAELGMRQCRSELTRPWAFNPWLNAHQLLEHYVHFLALQILQPDLDESVTQKPVTSSIYDRHKATLGDELGKPRRLGAAAR